MNKRGFTVLEVMVAGALFVVLLGSAAIAVATDTQAERVLVAQVGPEIAARTALERITAELRMAGVRGEDRNGNGELDPTEDLNENGELDSDWNLAEGATANKLSFNRRVEIRYTKDDLVPQGEYSRAVTYQLEEDRIVRIARQIFPGESEPRVHRSVLARRIARLQFRRTRSVIRVEIDVMLPKGVYKVDQRTIVMNVRLRN